MVIVVTILFILQLISFSFLFLLYLKVKSKETHIKDNEKMYEEIQKSLILYIEEMRKENDRFLEALDDRQTPKKTKLQGKKRTESKIVDEKLKSKQWKSKKVVPRKLAHQRYKEKSKVEQHLSENTSHEAVQGDLILTLYEEGYSVEEIAKQLKLGRTEVELHIKFRT